MYIYIYIFKSHVAMCSVKSNNEKKHSYLLAINIAIASSIY